MFVSDAYLIWKYIIWRFHSNQRQFSTTRRRIYTKYRKLGPFNAETVQELVTETKEATDLFLIKVFLFFTLPIIKSVDSLSNIFHVAVCLFSQRSQLTSNVVRKKKVAHEAQPTFWGLLWSITPLLLYRRTATCNLFHIIKEQIVVSGDFIYASVLQCIICKNKSTCTFNLDYR